MPDREYVITHLMIIHTWAEFARERDLQFFTAKHLEDIAKWSDDAIELLKEQKAVEPNRGLAKTQKAWFCGACGFRLNRAGRFCPKCGRLVKWNA